MKKKNVIIGIVSTILVVVLIILYMVVQDMRQEKILRNELEKMRDISFSTGTVDTKIKTKGDYAVVEKTAKEWFLDYLTVYQEMIGLIENKQITAILTAENYEKNRPEFTDSKKIIEMTKEKLASHLAKLVEFSKKEYMMSKITGQELDDYYVKIYEEVMIQGFVEQDFQEVYDDMLQAQLIMNQLLDAELQILEFLSIHNEEWKIEDGKIIFNCDELLEQYNALIATIPHDTGE